MRKKPFGVYGTEINKNKLFCMRVIYKGRQGVGFVSGSNNKPKLESFIPRDDLWKELENGSYMPLNGEDMLD